MTQTTIPNEPPDADAPHNTDAHMPAQPAPQDPVYATPRWNPETNEWAPSNEQHSTWEVGEPSHSDEPTAHPMSDAPGQTEFWGSIPDERLNLIDSVRTPRGPIVQQVVHHEHDVRTTETGAESLRFHQEFVSGSAPITLLTQNPARKRALLRIGSAVVNSQNNNLTAVGVPAIVTVPTGQTWTLQAISFLFTASAAAANRFVRIVVKDAAGRTIFTFVDATATTATQVDNVTLGAGLATQHVGAASPFQVTGALPVLVLPAGSTITADAIGEDVADTITVGTVMFSMTGSGVYLMPLRDGGNAIAASMGWQLNPGDGPIEIKSEAGVEAVAEAGGGATVFVYEELLTPGGVPGTGT